MIFTAKVKDNVDIDQSISDWGITDEKKFLSFPRVFQFEHEDKIKPQSMRDSGDFEYVSESTEMHTNIIRSTNAGQYNTLFPKWNLDRISKRSRDNYDTEYSSTQNGENVDIYVIDAGLNYNHPEFSNPGDQGSPRCRSINFGLTCPGDPGCTDIGGTDNAADAVGGNHGVSVSIIAGGQDFGIATESTIYSVRVAEATGAMPTSNLIIGFDAVIQHHINKVPQRHSVISISIGISLSHRFPASFDDLAIGGEVRDAVESAVTAGIQVCSAAGNGMVYDFDTMQGSVPGDTLLPRDQRSYNLNTFPHADSTVVAGDLWRDNSNLLGQGAGAWLVYDGGGGYSLLQFNSSGSLGNIPAMVNAILPASGYTNAMDSVPLGTHVTCFYTAQDPALFSSGIRAPAVNGDIWVRIDLLNLPHDIFLRTGGSWVDQGKDFTHLPGNRGMVGEYNQPSNAPSGISVGATDSQDSVAGFSNYGTSVDIFAPGVDIITPDPDATTNVDTTHSYIYGTSFAQPHVAGLAAVFLSDKTVPTGGTPDASATPAVVKAHLLNNSSTGLTNNGTTGPSGQTDIHTNDFFFQNYGSINLPLHHYFLGWVDSEVCAYNSSPLNELEFQVYQLSTSAAGAFTTGICYATVAKKKLIYTPNGANFFVGYVQYDESRGDVSIVNYSAFTAVNDRIVFNTFVDQSVETFQTDVEHKRFTPFNNNEVLSKAGTIAWSGEQIGNQIYTVSSGSLPAGVTLNTDGTFNSNVPTTQSPTTLVPFTVNVTDDFNVVPNEAYEGQLHNVDQGFRIFGESTDLTVTISAGNQTAITVTSTTGFPSKGTILVGVDPFRYDSTTATTFLGISQIMLYHPVGETVYTVDSDLTTKAHSLLNTQNIVGVGEFNIVLTLSDFPSDLHPQNIKVTARPFGSTTYTFDNVLAPVYANTFFEASIDRVADKINIRIFVGYDTEFNEDCVVAYTGAPSISAFEATLQVKLDIWYLNRANHVYFNELEGRLI